MKASDRARGALAGVRVVECGTGVSAPFCARLLADLGAEVIKLEPPAADPTRGVIPPGNAQRDAAPGLFAYLNAGKQSVLFDAGRAGDRDVLGGLLASADVLVSNLTSAERAAWQLDLQAVGAAHPQLVVVTLSELGESGALSQHRACEMTVCALGGASIILGERDRQPLSFPFNVPALQAGFHGAAAALAALLARRRRGGQQVEIAEADVLAFYVGGMSLFILGSGGKWKRRGFDRHGAMYPSGFYPCKDGYVFMATQTRAQWSGFLRLMGDPEWAQEDPVLQDGVAIGWRRADEVDLHFIPWLTQFTRRELSEMAAREGLVLGPINTVADLLDDAHLQARGFWTEVEVGETRVRLPGLGYTMSATPWRLGPPPQLGEHTGELRVESRESGENRSSSQLSTLNSQLAGAPQRPLRGYRAIEFGFNWAGPLVGQILADLGMEVIKIESRERLDFMRHWTHARRFFHNANRGKLSVSVNTKQPGGVELVWRLVARADIVFDNFAAGVMARNGLDYERLRRVKPDIIALSMAMAGQNGPLKHLRGFATIATGFAGLESAIGYPGYGSTGLPLLGLGDTNAAIQGVFACLAALWHREQTGEGQFIDLSQIEAATTLMAEPLAALQLDGRDAEPQANEHPWMAPHGIYPAAGKDRWVALAVAGDGEWEALVSLMGMPLWAREPELSTRAGRYARRAEIDARLAEWTAGCDRDRLAADLQAAGVIAAPVLELDEMNAHPHFRERGLWQTVASFEDAPEVVYRTPWHFRSTPAGVDRPSPKVGEHNDQVFGELLGMSAAEIRELTERKVIW